jgi:hypothetical protein
MRRTADGAASATGSNPGSNRSLDDGAASSGTKQGANGWKTLRGFPPYLTGAAQRRLVRVLTSTQTARTRMPPLTIICQ